MRLRAFIKEATYKVWLAYTFLTSFHRLPCEDTARRPSPDTKCLDLVLAMYFMNEINFCSWSTVQSFFLVPMIKFYWSTALPICFLIVMVFSCRQWSWIRLRQVVATRYLRVHRAEHLCLTFIEKVGDCQSKTSHWRDLHAIKICVEVTAHLARDGG
jgi:threonine/homoserine/homoserine lactone efflux protein